MIYLVDLIDFFHRGGIVLVLIFFTSCFLWIFLLTRYIYLQFIFLNVKNNLIHQLQESSQSKYKNYIKTYIYSKGKIKIIKNNLYIKTLIIIIPLLGILGTIVGMINIFDTLYLYNNYDIKLMASGISLATIPTMAGMFVSLSGILFEKKIDSLIKNHLHLLHLELNKAMQ